jgi:hypothetical protein
MPRRAAVLGIVLCALVGARPALAADTEIFIDPSVANVAAYHGVVVWSRKDSTTRKFRLVQRVNGMTSDAPVPPASSPFDPQVGPGKGGKPTVVYSRCSHGCDVFSYTIGANGEKRLASVSTPHCSEIGPSIWRSSFAVIRRGSHCRGGQGLWAGTTSRLRFQVKTTNSNQTALRGTEVEWGADWFLRVRTIGHGPDKTPFFNPPGEGESWSASRPEFGADGNLYFAVDHFLDGVPSEFTLARQRPATSTHCDRGNRRFTSDDDKFSMSVAIDGATIYYAVGTRGVFQATDPLKFTSGCGPIFNG